MATGPWLEEDPTIGWVKIPWIPDLEKFARSYRQIKDHRHRRRNNFDSTAVNRLPTLVIPNRSRSKAFGTYIGDKLIEKATCLGIFCEHVQTGGEEFTLPGLGLEDVCQVAAISMTDH